MDLVKSNTKPAKKSVSIYRDVDHKEKVGPLQHKSSSIKCRLVFDWYFTNQNKQ